MLVSDLNLIFLEKKEVDKYKNIKNKIFVKSKLDKRKKIPLLQKKEGGLKLSLSITYFNHSSTAPLLLEIKAVAASA